MDTLKTIIIALVVGAVVGGVVYVSKPERLEGVPGVNIIPSTQTAYSGGVHATSTSVSSTLTSDSIDYENIVDITLTDSDESITLWASTSVPGIPNPGDTRTVYIRNATTSATIDLTLVAGTGVALKSASTTSGVTSYVLLGDTDGKSMFEIELIRLASSDIVAQVIKFID